MSENGTSLEVIEPSEVVEAPTVLEQLTRGEVDMQVATARRWPRSLKRFKESAMAMAVKTPQIAQTCFYTLPRGGKKIEGPSIRLAEIVAVTWGNLRCESRVIDVGERSVTAQGTAWDIQTNVLVRKEAARRITDSRGRRYGDDMIIMTGNAAASIALRNAVFTVVPIAYVIDIYEHCKRVAQGDRGSLDEAKAKWVQWFGSKGATKEQLLDLLGRQGVEDITIDDITALQGLSTALAEGETTLEELFGPPEARPDGVRKFGFKARQEAAKAQADAEAATQPPNPKDEPPKAQNGGAVAPTKKAK
jgi:hypothetical protein